MPRGIFSLPPPLQNTIFHLGERGRNVFRLDVSPRLCGGQTPPQNPPGETGRDPSPASVCDRFFKTPFSPYGLETARVPPLYAAPLAWGANTISKSPCRDGSRPVSRIGRPSSLQNAIFTYGLETARVPSLHVAPLAGISNTPPQLK